MGKSKFKKLQELCHKIAVEKGFWDYTCNICGHSYRKPLYGDCPSCRATAKSSTERNNGEMIALMHSELSEALEDLRHGKKKHVGEELADCVIRVMDFCEARGVDLEKEILKKIKKNKKRPYKHGKKF